jgi:hypothetical protein
MGEVATFNCKLVVGTYGKSNAEIRTSHKPAEWRRPCLMEERKLGSKHRMQITTAARRRKDGAQTRSHGGRSAQFPLCSLFRVNPKATDAAVVDTVSVDGSIDETALLL